MANGNLTTEETTAQADAKTVAAAELTILGTFIGVLTNTASTIAQVQTAAVVAQTSLQNPVTVAAFQSCLGGYTQAIGAFNTLQSQLNAAAGN